MVVARESRIDKAGLGSLVAELLHNHTNAQITEILNRDHGVKIGWRAVENYTAKLRAERSRQARQAVQDAIAPTVTTDIATLDAAIKRLKAWFDDESLRRSERLLVIRELRQTIETKLRYSGANPTGELAESFAALVNKAVEE
jgi:hypothetical protein